MKNKNTFESAATAGKGLFFALRRQRSVQLIALIAAAVTAASFFLRLTAVEYMVLSVTVTLVLVAELINSGLEYAVDLATGEYNPLAKAAKDVSAAAVLLACVNSLVVAAFWLAGRLGWL